VKHKKTKTKYRLRNWGEYNRALVQRGSLTMGITEDVVQTWHAVELEHKRGHPRTYSDTAIVTMATLQEIYHLGLRQTQGLMASIGALLQLEVGVPDYSTLSRRRATLEIALPRAHRKEGRHI
jgi:Transposase DDE domain